MAVDWVATSAWVTGIGVFVALCGVGISFRQLRHQVRGLGEQNRLQVILQYTQRYEHTMDLFPKDVRAGGFHNADPGLAKDSEFLHAFLKYANLCSEEFHFRDVLDRDDGHESAWPIWEAEMRQNLTSPVGRVCWKTLVGAGQFDHYVAFRTAVDGWMNEIAAAQAPESTRQTRKA